MPSKLTFSIEESLWLNRGQEISEVLAMSLEPNISIQELDDHVVIKGGLLLHGEYRPLERESSDDSVDDDVKLSSHRLAKEVTVSEDGIGEVKHFIPIDVTIPTNRIQNLEDIYVHIDSFDYDLPERSCIQLTADITISGMSEVKAQSEQTYEQVNSYPSLDMEPFQFEVRRPLMPEHDGGGFSLEEEDDEATLETGSTSEELNDEQNEQLIEEARVDSSEEEIKAPEDNRAQEQVMEAVEENAAEEQVMEAVEENAAEEQVMEAVEENREQEAVVQFMREDEPILAQSEEEELSVEQEQPPQSRSIFAREIEGEPQEEFCAETEEVEESPTESELDLREEIVQEVREEQVEQEVVSEQEENQLASLVNLANDEQRTADSEVEAEEEVEEEPETESYSRKEENALYLTKMLQNGEEQFTRLKMCIIQENESLSTIAERYNLTTTQLIRANQLEEDIVTEGQILYIPTATSR